MYLIFLIIISEIGTSFMMLTAYRLTVGQTPWYPRHSYCDNCQQQLHWWQLIPLLSFAIQRGRCYFCQQVISPFIFAGELVVAIATYKLANYQLLHDSELVVLLLTLIFLSTTDFYAQFIYCWGLLPLLLLIPLTQSCWFRLSWQDITILLVTLLFLITLSRGLGGLGDGDVELITILLLIMGPCKAAIIVLIASLLILGWWLIKANPGRRLPFFPALAIGILFMIP